LSERLEEYLSLGSRADCLGMQSVARGVCADGTTIAGASMGGLFGGISAEPSYVCQMAHTLIRATRVALFRSALPLL